MCHLHQILTSVMCQLFHGMLAHMSADVRWLSADEEQLWRRWLLLNTRLQATLQREMQDDSGLSSSDFEVLVNLTDSPEGRVRVSDLATQMLWERSRLSHHVTRMERRGMVQRMECAEDGRGAFVAITPAGRTAIEKAAPGHVQAVRQLVFDALSGEEVSTLATLVDKLLARLNDEATPG
jgi:DNA-binding MarR family transcriptional regulator